MGSRTRSVHETSHAGVWEASGNLKKRCIIRVTEVSGGMVRTKVNA